jgi:hypothetical protein
MNIEVKHGLPFVAVTIRYRGSELLLERVLLDTGSAGTIDNANFEFIHFGDVSLEDFQVEIGNMDYGMEINGIIGFDFISAANLLIDTKNMLVYSVDSSNNKKL